MSLAGATMLSACAGERTVSAPETAFRPNTSADMYRWEPPSREALKIRRFRQGELDRIAGEIEALYIQNESQETFQQELAQIIAAEKSAIDGYILGAGEKLASLEAKSLQTSGELSAMEKELFKIESEILMEKEIDEMKEENRYYSGVAYGEAVRLFAKKQLPQALARFNKALRLNPAPNLADNIHFGLASTLYRLGKADPATRNLEYLVSHYPQSEKWFMANTLLGWIYNQQGEKSKALYALDRARRKNPPQGILSLIERLDKLIQEPAPEEPASQEQAPEAPPHEKSAS